MRLQEAKRQLKNHLLSEVADEVNARREEKQESEEQAVVIKGTDADQSGQTIKGLEKRIEGNRQLLEQTHSGVTMLNRYITSFLGRDEVVDVVEAVGHADDDLDPVVGRLEPGVGVAQLDGPEDVGPRRRIFRDGLPLSYNCTICRLNASS